jgi:hypothetical protein
MSGILKSKVSTFEYDLRSMESLIAADLNVAVNTINVTYVIEEVGGDPMDRFRGIDTVTKISVTITNKG